MLGPLTALPMGVYVPSKESEATQLSEPSLVAGLATLADRKFVH